MCIARKKMGEKSENKAIFNVKVAFAEMQYRISNSESPDPYIHM
jgi:hypothetical protein